MATDALAWNEDEIRFPLEGRILFTQPNEGNSISNWKKAWTVKLAPVQAILAVLATEELPELSPKKELIFPSDTAPIKEASLVIVKKDKNSSKFSLVRVSNWFSLRTIKVYSKVGNFYWGSRCTSFLHRVLGLFWGCLDFCTWRLWEKWGSDEDKRCKERRNMEELFFIGCCLYVISDSETLKNAKESLETQNYYCSRHSLPL